LSTVYYWTGW